MDRLMSTNEVARILNVSTRTVRRLAESRVIPGARKIGRNWRFDPKKFWEWLISLERSEDAFDGKVEKGEIVKSAEPQVPENFK